MSRIRKLFSGEASRTVSTSPDTLWLLPIPPKGHFSTIIQPEVTFYFNVVRGQCELERLNSGIEPLEKKLHNVLYCK